MTIFDLLQTKQQGDAISKGIKSTVEICSGDLLRISALKRSTKRAMYSSFHNAPYTKLSTSKTTTEM